MEHNTDLFGNPITQEKRSMSDYFGVPPFSILNTVEGDWQARKRKWNSLIGDQGQAREGVLGDSDGMLGKISNGTSILDACLVEVLLKWFTEEGYTAIWLLGESHFAIHTFPEQGKTYIELTSCNPEKHDFFVANIKR